MQFLYFSFENFSEFSKFLWRPRCLASDPLPHEADLLKCSTSEPKYWLRPWHESLLMPDVQALKNPGDASDYNIKKFSLILM